MVHQIRTPSKAIPAKHLSPMRSQDSAVANKYAVSSSPADSFLSNGRLTVNGSSGSGGSRYSAAHDSTVYKYNNMVKNNREEFNALHFC